MKVTVTGGSGFVGSHVVDHLLDAGHEVIVVDTRPPHRGDVVYREGDVTDLSALVRATAGCDAVFHLAAVSNVNDAHADPVGTMEVNVVGTARVSEAARRNRIGRVIMASTVWVYASGAGNGPLYEDTPLASTGSGHVYTASKIAADKFEVHVQGGRATITGKTDVLQHKGTATRMAHSAGATDVVNRIEPSEAAKEKAAANLTKGRRRAQIKRSETEARSASR